MRIFFVTPVFPPYRAGMSHVAFLYARWAYEAGHEVHVFTPDMASEHDQKHAFFVHRIRPLIRYGNASYIFSFEYDGDAPDVIHLHFPFIGGMLTFLFLLYRYPRARRVVTYHMDLIGSSVFRQIFFRVWRFFTLRIVAWFADVIHVTSKDYFESSQLGSIVSVADPRVREIPLSIDSVHFSNRLHDDEWCDVLLVASLDEAHRFKGVCHAIDAIALLNTKGVHARLCVVGDGTCMKEYQRYAHDKNVSSLVRFVGGVSDELLRDYYSHARMCVLPSISASEAFGLVLIEAQAAGTPVIASDLSGVRTVFQEGITGLRVRPSDSMALAAAVEFLMTLPDDQYARWSQSARLYVATHYHPDVVRDIVLSLYT